ncbi:MAG: class I SAM-dependent methyltransferase [Cyanobacteria bacterium J06621_8]
MSTYQSWYQPDLAYIHDLGFGELALKSAPAIIAMLRQRKLNQGLIVDLGCGSGLSAQRFIQANYQVLGIDMSPSMIELAKTRVPSAEFRVESLFQAEIPPCVAVTSVGECLNYLFDQGNSLQALANLGDRIYQALIPGGLFIFDVLQPMATVKTQGFKEGKDWIVIYEKDENFHQKTLSRRIITLRKEGSYYRREEETHQVCLYEPLEIKALLEQIGFQVQTQSNYGEFQLSEAHTVFIASK